MTAVGGCTVAPAETQATSTDAINSATVACTANDAQIALAGAGAATAVAGYVTAAAIAVEALVAAGADAQVIAFGRNLSGGLVELAGATAEREGLVAAIEANSVRDIATNAIALLGKIVSNGNVRAILGVGYALLAAIKDGLITLDKYNPVGIATNLDYLNDGLRFACGQCGVQGACAPGITASRMADDVDFRQSQANDSANIAKGRECARSTTYWSRRSYLTQCMDCCTASGYTDASVAGYHSCRAVCNAAYQ